MLNLIGHSSSMTDITTTINAALGVPAHLLWEIGITVVADSDARLKRLLRPLLEIIFFRSPEETDLYAPLRGTPGS